MGRKIIYGLAAAGLLLLGACSHPPRSLAEIEDADTGDSLLYYYGQMRANEYWQRAMRDTSLRSEKERQRYLDGIRDGLRAVRDDGEIYNDGLRAGVRMGINLRQFSDIYGLDFDEDVLFEAIEKGLDGYDDIPELEYQQKFDNIVAELRQVKKEENKKISRVSLIEVAREKNMTKVYDDLYYRVERQGSGETGKEGMHISPTIDFYDMDGHMIDVPTPEQMVIGATTTPKPITEAFKRLNKGTEAVFATSARAVFKSRAINMGLQPTDVIIMHIIVNDLKD